MTNVHDEADGEWFRLAAAGDTIARQRLLSKHRQRLRRMIAVRLDRRLLARVDPSDIVQETLLLADRRLDEYLRELPIPFYPWLRQLAWDQLVAAQRRHLYARRRSRSREEPLATSLSDESVAELAGSLVDNTAEPLARLVSVEMRERVRMAVDQLPALYREILVLRHLEQLSTAEAAAVLGIGQSAVKMRHLRALESIKSLLSWSDEVSP